MAMTMQLKQLDDANKAWQQYQQNQSDLLRDRFKLSNMDDASFEDLVQQIENRLHEVNDQLVELQEVNSKLLFNDDDNMISLRFRISNRWEYDTERNR
jgi:hypothetical protein